MKIPTRPAPCIPRNEPSRENLYQSKKPVGQVKPKKKPPPRPPPPKFNNRKPDFTTSLIDLSAPLDDYLQAANTKQDLFTPLSNNDFFKTKLNTNNDVKPMPTSSNDYFHSKSSANDEFFKSKTTNDFYKKKSTVVYNNYSVGNSSFFGNNCVNHLDLATGSSTSNVSEITGPKTNIVAPTIIRAQAKVKKDIPAYLVNDVNRSDLEANNYSPPMPTIPPPSPPKYVLETINDTLPHGIALHNFNATHKDDLPLQVNDIVILLHQINEDWLYGRVGSNEGMFPANFIDIRVPLSDQNDNVVTALYEFNAETHEDLKLIPGQKIKVLKKVSQDWLYGESNGNFGQFPANFVDHIPTNI